MFITVGEAKIYAVSFGPRSGRAIVALSGWIGTWEDWADTLSILSNEWQTAAYDQRGSGVTMAPLDSITLDTLLNDLFAIMDNMGIESCILAAMSAGAAVAFKAALKAPERFSALVIVDGMDFSKGPELAHPFLSFLKRDYDAALDYFIDACIPEENSDPIKEWGRKILGRASQEGAIRLFEVVQGVDLRQDLPSVSQPTLILHGEKDSISPIESAVWLAQTLPNATLKTLSGAGHVPIMTRPDEVAQEIITFIMNQEMT